MGALLSYSLAVSVIILVLYPILHRIVNRSTSFCFNRSVIICGIVSALFLPLLLNTDLISLPSVLAAASADMSAQADHSFSDSIPTAAGDPTVEPAMVFPWVAIALAVYLAGVIIMLGREIAAFIRLFRMISSSEKTAKDGITVCLITDNATAPFSWGSFIFLHYTDSQDLSGCIYLHEKSHTDKRHWIDVLLADLLCILIWYNPFGRMTRRLMKLNHEFEADSSVINSGIDTYDYQRLLVTKAMETRAIQFTNSFAADKRAFRKRVLIMNRKRSSRRTMLLAVWAMPAIFLAVYAVASPISVRVLDTISDYKFSEDISADDNHDSPARSVSDLTTDLVTPEEKNDTVMLIPSPLKDQTALAEIIKLSMSNIQNDREVKVNIEIVVDKNGYIKDVITNDPSGSLLAAAIDRNLRGVRFEQTTDNGSPIETHFSIPIVIKKTE